MKQATAGLSAASGEVIDNQEQYEVRVLRSLLSFVLTYTMKVFDRPGAVSRPVHHSLRPLTICSPIQRTRS